MRRTPDRVVVCSSLAWSHSEVAIGGWADEYGEGGHDDAFPLTGSRKVQKLRLRGQFLAGEIEAGSAP